VDEADVVATVVGATKGAVHLGGEAADAALLFSIVFLLILEVSRRWEHNLRVSGGGGCADKRSLQERNWRRLL